jgi:tetratricopeptide (TPR) repeat protein
MDHYFLGLAHYNKGPSAEHLDQARSHFDRALNLDPNNVEALVQRAWVDVNFVANYLSDDRAKQLRSAEADLTKALKLRPDHAIAHCALGASHMYGNRALQGIAECERALAIDRNYANAHTQIGVGKIFVGRSNETEAHILEALRISPRDTRLGVWAAIAGIAEFYSGRDEEAVAWLSRSSPNAPVAHFYFAAALARLDRLEEARDATRAGLELNPSFTIARFRSSARSDNPVYLAGRERVCDGLRKAGLPEE